MPLVYEENIPVTFAPAVADLTAPTTTEVDAGTDYSSYIPKDGIQFPSGRAMVPTDSIDRKFDSQYPGSESGPLVITFKLQDRSGTQAAWDEFVGGEVEGYLIFGFEGSNNTESDVVDVYHVVGHTPVRNNPGGDIEQRFVVNFGVQEWEQAATVASGA